ncbi:SDR family oxidoreductase [Phyllobacterium zundukense]|uniref:SDR family oxidoreductase n=1 Tax=Phyllobacterium zundukense TaxID=1867719 RepID=A0ACD4CYD1_9HYPH|nr:SDR family oxidoreductase [Phyllobacterium zundukense]UXN58473.1 SDR family oxidoreductase [Phyllobacterium zundukense]
MDINFQGKVVLITGGARGIGRALALRFGALGASVVVNYGHSADVARDTVREIESAGGKAVAIGADVSNVTEIDQLFDKTSALFGKPDIVIVNAGIEVVGKTMIEVEEADFDRVFAINTKGAFFTMRRAAQDVSDNGRIIFIGSSSTLIPTAGYALYSGSKRASAFFVEVLAKELGARGVTVNSILPTVTEGAGLSAGGLRPAVRHFIEQNNPMKRAGTPEDVANTAIYLASNLASFVSGQHLLLSGGGQA